MPIHEKIAIRKPDTVEQPKHKEILEAKEGKEIQEGDRISDRRPGVVYLENTSRAALRKQSMHAFQEMKRAMGQPIEMREAKKEASEQSDKVRETKKEASEEKQPAEVQEAKAETLTEAQKEQIQAETGWDTEIVENIQNMEQYEALKEAGLVEAEIDGEKCLVKEHIDLEYTDEDGVTNRERMERGLPPLDSETGKPIELHHLGQKEGSPLVELTEEEHRTGDYEDGKKNQSLWHDNTMETEVHGEGNSWTQERKEHWQGRANSTEGK